MLLAAALFDKDSGTIGSRLRNAVREGEWDELGTTEDSSVVRQAGKRVILRAIRFYKPDERVHNGCNS